MLTFHLDPTQLAADKAYALANYSYDPFPGGGEFVLGLGDWGLGFLSSNDPYGMYEYFIENDPQGGGYMNMGLDATPGTPYYYYKKGSGSIICRMIGGGTRYRCRARRCCPCIVDPIPCPCNCTGHDIIPPPGPIPPIPPPPGILPPGTIQPIPPLPEGPTPPPVTSTGTYENNGGGVGDPHFEGFDRLFDFHGQVGKCYQLYKSKSLLINCKMAPAYHCQENGTFMEGIYVRSYQNGKEFEVVFSIWGIADLSKVLIPIKENLEKNLVNEQASNKKKKTGDWINQIGAVIKADIGDIYLVQSNYLGQPHINLKLTPKIMEPEATGIIGQTHNMKIRLPNETFEIDDINSDNILTIVTPELYFPIKYSKNKNGKKKPCFTCQDKLKRGEVFTDEFGQKWAGEDASIALL